LSGSPQPAGSECVDVSALVVNYNTAQLALDMLRSLAAQDARAPDGRPLRVEFIFVDNASPMQHETELALIRELAASEHLPGRVVMHRENAGYARGMNLAWSYARGEYAFVLNPDLVLLPNCVTELYAALRESDDIGAVGPVGYWERGCEVLLPPNILPTLWDLWFCTLAHSFCWVNRRYVDARLRNALRVYTSEEDVTLDMLSGACVFLSRQQIDAMGGLFDPEFPLYYEDTDLFRRVSLTGKRLVMVKSAAMAHFYNRSAATNTDEAQRRYWLARDYYYGKWYGWVGRLSERLCRRFLGSPFASRARQRLSTRAVDLGDVNEPPTIHLGRHCERFVLELCQDAGFLLAAAIPGKGSTWTPGPSFWNAFGDSEYFLRAVDLSHPEPEELSVYRFRRVGHPGCGDNGNGTQ
jgi:hypothetical protein